MAVIFHNKLIFLEHPRTASTSVRHVLQQVGGKPHKRHVTLAPRHREKTVCTVRNPYDLLVSWWLIIGGRQGFKTFADFVVKCRDPFMVRNEKLFYFLETDYVMRFETLEQDLNTLLRKHKIRKVKLPKYNTTKDKKHYTEYYDDVIRALVTARFEEEIKRFGYEWND